MEVTSRPGVGVKVPVQTVPDSSGSKSDTTPPSTCKSVASNSRTFSLKVTVTTAVSPIFRAVSDKVIVAVGPCVSISAESLAKLSI